ncbi:MAG: hypothetical protein GY861_10590, partial [bacterium]|nr:hypothetical protein [bacterium]
TFENTLRRLAIILEEQVTLTQGLCPGTDADLIRILRKVEEKRYFQYYRTTIDQKVRKEWIDNPEFKKLLRGETAEVRTKCIEAITQWKVQFAKKKKNILLIDYHKYEGGGKVSTLKSAGKPINDSTYPYFALIDLWIEVLGDAPEDSPLTPEHWKKMNEIVYNKIPPISSHLCNTKDWGQTKAVLLEMMRFFVLYGAQDASVTLFVARAVAIITQNLPI